MDLYKKLAGLQLIFIIVLVCGIQDFQAKQNAQKATVEELTDIKDFKKILRTKNNVLVCYISSQKQASHIVKIFKEAAEVVKGQGTMLLVDCSGEAKKMCKKLKVSPEPFMLKHYKDGDFHKDYDRLETMQSMVNFMRDPSGDIPWEEDNMAVDVVHISDALNLAKFLRKEVRPILVLFYAPWCGFCKQLKPEYAAAASELKGHSIMAAIDVNRPENAIIRQQYNITGFPTMLYFENGHHKFMYEGENNKNGLIGFMKNPSKPPEKPKEEDWSTVKSDVVHLTSENFDTVITNEPSVLVMFYAPWCGHCKKMKPEYEKAAATLKAEQITGVAAAIDATKEPAIAARYNIRGYPTVKYFKAGEFAFDVNVRDAAKITEFMRDPREPPPPPPPETPWSEEPSEVVHLTEETFKTFLKKKKHVLVMFYAPWCGHCKKAKPEFTAAAEHFKDDPKVEFAAVDCTKFSAICGAVDVKGYPTFKYFHYYTKETKNYNGGRVEADFVNFMKNPLSPTVSATVTPEKMDKDDWGDYEGAENLVHLSDDTFDAFISIGQPVLVMFYAPWCGHCKLMKPSYSLAALQMKQEHIQGVLAAVDATGNPKLSDRFNIVHLAKIFEMSNNAFVSKQQHRQSLPSGGTSIRVSNEGSCIYEHVGDKNQVYNRYEDTAKKCSKDKESPKRRKNLLHFRDMPPHLQFNPYIFTGYRPLLTFWGSINSLFYLHNETINILTHGIPIVYILVTVPSLMPWDHIESHFLPWCHIIGAVSPWIGSFVYHLFMNLERGEVVYYKLLQLDMLGIWISQSFGALPMVYASVFCLSWACRWLILSSYCLLSMWGLYKALTAWSPWERRLCFLLPFVMRILLCGLRYSPLGGGDPASFVHVVLQDAVSALGGAIGAMHIPEKWFPGTVDMYLNSHNIMHVLVVMAVYSMHQATVRDLLWMAHVDCRTGNQPIDTFGGLQATEEL